MKRMLTAALTLALAGAIALPAFAYPAPTGGLVSPNPTTAPGSAKGYTIEVDGREITSDVQIMVPLAAVAQALGYQVTWDNGSVLLDNGAHHTRVTIGRDSYVITTSSPDLVGMSAPFSLGAAPYVQDGVSYVPVTLFDKLLGGTGSVAVEGGVISIHTQKEGSAQIANPFITCDTMAQAQEIAGFSMVVPEAGDAERTIQAVEGSLLQVIDRRGDSRTLMRKAVGSGDVSGDYNVYPQTRTVQVDGRTVTMKGADGLVSLAVWADGGYAYSISAGSPMTPDRMVQLVGSIQ